MVSAVTCVYSTGRPAVVLKSTIDTAAPVSDSEFRNALVAFLTVCVWPEDAIEPDSSSTSITSIPQRGGRSGFGRGRGDAQGVRQHERGARRAAAAAVAHSWP